MYRLFIVFFSFTFSFYFQPTLGLGPKTSGEYVDGRIVCHYSYIRTKTLLKPSQSDKPAKQDDSDLLADLTKNKYFMIVAKGELSPEGKLICLFY